MTAGRCTSCGQPTVNIYNLCDPCRRARTHAERVEQGLPPMVEDPSKLARTARLLLTPPVAADEEAAAS